MAFANYTDLQASIAGWLSRTDLTTRIPDFIALAESRINRKLRVLEMETSATGTLSTQTLNEPADLLEIQRLILYPTGREVEVEYSAAKNMLLGANSGVPRSYTRQNQLLYFAPTPDTGYTYRLFYYQRIPALAANATNWLLTASPDVYLYASLLEAEPYLKNDKRIATWAAAYQAAMVELQEASDKAQFPRSSLVIRGDMRL